MVHLRGRLAAPLAALALAAPPLAAQTLHTELVANGFANPVWVGSPAGDERVFVLEQNTGRIRIVQDGAVLPTPFLDLGGAISTLGERGLLGLAFHPDFDATGTFVVVYTGPVYTHPDFGSNTVDTFVSTFQVSAGDPNVADPASEVVLLQVPQPYSNHNGGGVAFGPLDGYLYVALGDGGSVGAPPDPFCSAQDPGSLLGKVLRIDVDSGSPYAIPPDNPFVGTPGARGEVWSGGFRNPWRFSLDPLTGDLYVGDVGQADREEIDYEPAGTGGRNYGWRVHEGTLCQGPGSCVGVPPCGAGLYTPPIHEYAHFDPIDGFLGCSVIGGVVYRGCAIPSLQGAYLFADYCSNKIWSFRVEGGAKVDFQERTFDLAPGGGLTINAVTSFGVDGGGEVLIADYSGGEVFRVVPQVSVDCDGDGTEDACQLAGDPAADLDGDGTLDACQELSADVASVSASAGGTQTLSLHAGGAHAGELYLLLGSLTGTSPGFPYAGFVVPLNLDAYFLLTLNAPNQPPLASSFGALDGGGAGQATFTVTPGSTSLAGLTAHHAYGALDPVTLALQLVSNPVSVEIAP